MQENRLTAATNELNDAQAQLDDKQKELDKVQAIYDAAMAEKQVSHHRAALLFIHKLAQGSLSFVVSSVQEIDHIKEVAIQTNLYKLWTPFSDLK